MLYLSIKIEKLIIYPANENTLLIVGNVSLSFFWKRKLLADLIGSLNKLLN